MHFNLEHLIEPMKYIALLFIIIYIVMYIFRVRHIYKITGKVDRHVLWLAFISVTPKKHL